MSAPPVYRCDLLPTHEHREMQVIATCKPSHPAAADRLGLFHLVADLDVQ